MQTSSFQWADLGAQLLQARSDLTAAPLFYLSPHYRLGSGKPARGGVPVMFPQFATRGPGPKHGLVRQRDWLQTTAAALTPGETTYELDLPAQPDQHWMGQARLRVSALWGSGEQGQCLQMRFEAQNTGDVPFEFTGGLHPYFAVHDVGQLSIQGLDGTAFEDRYEDDKPMRAGFLKGQAFERLYHQAPAIVLDDGLRRLHLQAEGFDNWMVWNPGTELAAGLGDMPLADWQRFVCVEPVLAAKEKHLGVGEVFAGRLAVTLLPQTA
jgi:glucose-6-phosphate 1-epimerase